MLFISYRRAKYWGRERVQRESEGKDESGGEGGGVRVSFGILASRQAHWVSSGQGRVRERGLEKEGVR